jgi:hypothetical protein
MATHSFTTTVIQETALTYKRSIVNAQRASQSPPLPPFDDNPAYVDDVVRNTLLGPLVQEYVETRLQQVANAYRTATNTQRQTVDSTLGL